MIVFFDILALDDDVCVRKAHRERRLLLKDIVRVINGRASIAEQVVLDFSHRDSPYQLERLFAKAIAQRWEGCVLKGCDDPYFSIFQTDPKGSSGRWIKLKKDYIPGLGDTVDLVLIGAKYLSQDANSLRKIPKLLWTHFFIGTLVNKEAVSHLGATPRFRVIDVINRHCASLQNIQILNHYGEFCACSPKAPDHGFHIEHGKTDLPKMDVVFKTPFVVEMLGSGFERPSNARFYSLRFPRITKIHWDRTFEHAVSFQELQSLADSARAVIAEDDSGDQEQEQEQWSKRIKLSNGKPEYAVSLAQSFSTTTTSTQEIVDSSESGLQDNESSSHISIHVDETAKSRSPSFDTFDTDWNGTPLTETVNQSSCRNRHPNEGCQENLDENAKHSASRVQNQPTKSRHPAQDAQCQTLYVALNKDSSCLPRTGNIMENFFQNLAKQYNSPRQKSPKLALGLAILNPSTTRLGPEMLSIIQGLARRIQKAQVQSNKFPPSGKIIFLDSNIWSLGGVSKDFRISFRTAWERITKECFYACISWKAKSPHAPPQGISNNGLIPERLAVLNTDISVTFEKEEMGFLREYCH